MQTVLLLGGDSRTRYLDRFFTSHGYSTYCFGVYAPIDFTDLKYALGMQYVSIILPLPVTKDGKSVQCPLTNSALPFETLIQLTAAENTVYGGILPKNLTELCLRKGVRAVEYYDEEVIVQNAALTAEGTLRVLCEYGINLQTHPHVAVMGFGRVAKATARTLLAAGCVPTVAARNPAALDDANRMGCAVLPLNALLADASSFDVIINTVPAPLFTEKELAHTKKTVCIVDVASAPFGVDFAAAKALSRTAVKAQSLPGKYTPQAAAEVIGEKLCKLISE
ncbi:MAG: dipicolinate synthase subunit DpsA [Candidatus Fimenecus sp.]